MGFSFYTIERKKCLNIIAHKIQSRNEGWKCTLGKLCSRAVACIEYYVMERGTSRTDGRATCPISLVPRSSVIGAWVACNPCAQSGWFGNQATDAWERIRPV